jgi:ATP-dependent Lhr-like helicase
VADAGLRVQFQSGKVLGTIEESFITRLRPGDRFVFAGRVLELIRVREMTAVVKRATRVKGTVPRWNGGKMPLSTQLAMSVRRRIALADDGVYEGPEMETIRPLLERQKAASRLPQPDELLIERIRTRDGHHAFVYPFAGRLAHEGLGAVLSLRLSRARPASFRATVTDYGVELFCEEPFDVDEPGWRAVLSSENLVEDLLESMNATQLARRHFREIARIAGLTHQGYPGAVRSVRHLQASSEMFFDVFEQFDPGNMLLTQAKREVLEGQLEFQRIRGTLVTLSSMKIVIVAPGELTPMSFPLWAESLRATTVSSETWEQRVRKMVVKLEGEATKARSDKATQR